MSLYYHTQDFLQLHHVYTPAFSIWQEPGSQHGVYEPLMDMLYICSFFRGKSLWFSSRPLPSGNPWSDEEDLYTALNLRWKHSPASGSTSLKRRHSLVLREPQSEDEDTALSSGSSHLMERTQLLFLGTSESEGNRKYRKQFKSSHTCQAIFYQLCPVPWREPQQSQGPGRRFWQDYSQPPPLLCSPSKL